METMRYLGFLWSRTRPHALVQVLWFAVQMFTCSRLDRFTIGFEVVRARHQVECQIDDNFTRFDEHSVGVTSVRNLLVISALVFVTSALKFWSVGLKGSRAAGSNFVASTLSHNHQRPAG